jgi:archaeosine synthase
MARAGLLRVREVQHRTPNVLYADYGGLKKPDWAEAGLSTQADPALLWTEGFAEMDLDGTAPLSRPLSLATLEFPSQSEKGDIAFLADPEEARKTEKEIVALQNTVEFLRYPKEFVRAMISLRQASGYQRVLYTPLLATPSNLPVLVYCGVDLMDVLRVYYDSGKGRFHAPEGALAADDLDEWPCMCPGCERRDLMEHNLRAMMVELRRVRAAIQVGNLRELVEQRVSNDPWMTAVLRELDYRFFEWQELHFPVVGFSLRAYSKESLHRPDVLRFRKRVKERYRKPASAGVLLFLPCSARKPYSTSRSHRIFRSIIRAGGNQWAVHVVVVTSPLGIVPMDLELFYPAQHYDVPVTGDWSKDEVSILQEDVESLLEVNSYESVIVHLGPEAEILEGVVEDAVVTSRENPRSPEALERLRSALEEATSQMPLVPRWRRHLEDLRCMARFQFGEGGDALVEGCITKGRYPNLRLIKEGRQVAALTGARGMFSLTLEGGEILSKRGLYWVEIEDFYPEGNVFAVGVVDAHSDVRVGDDVVVRCGTEVRAVGVARMNPVEMRTSNRGEAVKVRHRIKMAET